ncbi:MAG: nucleotide exchange factor GrpE [Flavobacteriales bacterium]
MEEKAQTTEGEIHEAEAAETEGSTTESEEKSAQNEMDSAVDSKIGGDTAGDKVSTPETDWQDKYLRLYAEFDNFRKRSMRERGDLIRNASKDVLERMLPVMDDFERALKAGGDAQAMQEGMKLIQDKLINTLNSEGLKAMEVESGDPFDVEVHEAITRIPAPSEDLVGKVVDVVEQGYRLNDHVLRYAKVVVGS